MRQSQFLVSAVCATAILSASPAFAARTVEELNALASLRYQSAQTEVVSARLADAKILALRSQVDRQSAALNATRSQLKTAQASAQRDKAAIAKLTSELEKLLNEVTKAKNDFTEELSRRDADYARDIAILQMAGEQLLATPEGVAALALYNAGGPNAFEAADAVLGQIETARTTARENAARKQQAEDRRVRARLALDARDKGLTNSAIVAERWEAVVAVGDTVARDWLTLSDVYLETGQMAKALEASNRALESAMSPVEKSLALERRGNVNVADFEYAAALADYEAALKLDRQQLATNGETAKHLRAVSVLLRNVAVIVLREGNIASARSMFVEALSIDRRQDEIAPSAIAKQDISIDIAALADVDRSAGDLISAEAQLADAIARSKDLEAAEPQSVLGRRNLAIDLAELASIQAQSGKYKESIATLKEVRKIDNWLIQVDPSSLESVEWRNHHLSQLANVFRTIESHEEAKPLLEERRASAKSILDIDPVSPRRLAAYAYALEEMTPYQGYDQQLVSYTEILSIWRSLSAVNSGSFVKKSTASTLRNIGIVYEITEKFVDAKKYYNESLLLLGTAIAGDQSVGASESMALLHMDLADVESKQGNFAMAATHALKSVNLRRDVSSKEKSRTSIDSLAFSLNRLATAWQRVEKQKEALAVRREEIEIRRDILANSQIPEVDRTKLGLTLLATARTAALAGDSQTEQAAYLEGLALLRARVGSVDDQSLQSQFIYSLNNFANAASTPIDLKIGALQEQLALMGGSKDARIRPTDADYYSQTVSLLATTQLQAGKIDDARATMVSSLAALNKPPVADPGDMRIKRAIAVILLSKARLENNATDWQAAVSALSDLADGAPLSPNDQLLLDEAKTRLQNFSPDNSAATKDMQ